MTDPNLTELLERVGERTHVGPPPVERMMAGARRMRRRRSMLLTAATAAAVVATVGGATLLSAPGSNSQDHTTPAASPSVTPTTSGELPASVDLEGAWRVRALVGANGQSVFLPDSPGDRPRLTFTDGEMTGTTGCNDVFGTYKQSGGQGQDLRFPPQQLGSTLVGCSDEPPLVSRLLDVRHVSGSAGTRYLHAENWMIVAKLRR